MTPEYEQAKKQMADEAAKRQKEREAEIRAMPEGKQKDLLMKMQNFVTKDTVVESGGETESTEEKK